MNAAYVSMQMKEFTLLVSIMILPIFSFGQTHHEKIPDKNLSKLQSNIFRINITQATLPDYETNTLSGAYEHQIKNAFTFLGKIGIGYAVDKFGSSDDPYQISYHLYSAVETRYYFTLKRRQKKEKSVLNFSCPYVSLEQTLYSNQFALDNQIAKKAFEGSTRTFINLGCQKQIVKFYMAAFFGASIFTKDFAIYGTGRSIRPLHGGVIIGYVFN